ncbi:MAG: DUF4328 domain-containing protein [Xanthomonadales bacterium]|nr:DUF4328 domain-containing protein [Xanthomonadales bacterium]
MSQPDAATELEETISDEIGALPPVDPVSEPAALDRRWHMVRLVLLAQVVVALVAILGNLAEYRLLADFRDGLYQDDITADRDAQASDQRQSLIGMTQIAVFVVSGVVILLWLYRSARHVRALGATRLQYTPGWTVGWFFIPLFSLWVPYLAVRELWEASNDPARRPRGEGCALLGWWWTLWLANGFAGQAVWRMARSAETVEQFIRLNVVGTLGEVLGIALAAVSLALFADIHGAQRMHAARLTQQSSVPG